MIWRVRFLALSILAGFVVAAWRLAEIQLIHPEDYRHRVYRNPRLEQFFLDAATDGDIDQGPDGALRYKPEKFNAYQARYLETLIRRGLIRAREDRIVIEPGFTRRVNPSARRESPALVRGKILDRAGRALAWSEIVGGRLARRGLAPEAFFHVIGTANNDALGTGLERACDADLRAPDPSLRARWRSFWLGPRPGLNVVTTLDARLQRIAYDAIGDRKGALVALDPSTGDLLAVVSRPSIDPNASTRAWIDASDAGPAGPLCNRAFEGFYPPGSTFKTIVAAAVLGEDLVSPDERIRCDGYFHPLPGAAFAVHDHEWSRGGFRGHNPRGAEAFDIAAAYAASCNVAFARLGVLAGSETIDRWARRFGFGERIPILTTAGENAWPVAPSRVVNAAGAGAALRLDDAQAAQTAIGQFEVRVTPLQMALVAAAIANDGVTMKPRLVRGVARPDGKWVRRVEPEPWRRALSPKLAGRLAALMRGVVVEGTGRRLAARAYAIAAKTGTAQVPGREPHGWFIGFAPADNPRIAVACVIENGGYGSSSAGPVVRRVMDAFLQPETDQTKLARGD